MITITSSGSFDKTERWLRRLAAGEQFRILDRHGPKLVAALSAATPVESGQTAGSWSYKIVRSSGRWSIELSNSHVENGVNIAVILQYGHGTRNGGYVQGRDYINPAIRPIFDEIANAAWREVTRV